MKTIFQELSDHLHETCKGTDTYVEVLEELRLHSAIVNTITEGVILVSAASGTIVYTNPTFDNMFGYGSGELAGKHVSVINAPTDTSPEATATQIMAVLEKTGHWQGEVRNVKKDGTPFWCSASVSALDHHHHGKLFVSVHTDITARKVVEAEREQLIAELKDALANIKTLQGLIPICAYCKKIRNDEGYWQQLDVYVKQHADVSFTHGSCPECFEKVMKEFHGSPEAIPPPHEP